MHIDLEFPPEGTIVGIAFEHSAAERVAAEIILQTDDNLDPSGKAIFLHTLAMLCEHEAQAWDDANRADINPAIQPAIMQGREV